jgi:hypothetical protein
MKLATVYKSFVAGTIAWADALAEALGKKKYLSAEVVEELAKAHAEAYGEKYKRTIWYQQTSSGAWVFYKDEACKKVDKDTTATRQWERDVEQYHNITKRTTTVSKKVDVVEQKAKSIKAWGMTKAQVLKAVELAFSK